MVMILKKIKYLIKLNLLIFRTSSLSNLVDNLAEVIPKIKCKGCDCFLEYKSVGDNLIKK